MPAVLDHDKLADLTEKTARLRSLQEHPGWEDLRQHFTERRDAWMNRLRRNLLNGGAVDQREIDRHAGFWKGAEFILDHPDMTDKKLATALARAQRDEGDSE